MEICVAAFQCQAVTLSKWIVSFVGCLFALKIGCWRWTFLYFCSMDRFTDMLSGHRGHPCHPTHGTGPHLSPQCHQCHSPAQPWALQSQVCSCPCPTLRLASVTHFGGALGCPQPVPLPRGGWGRPCLVLSCSFTVLKQAVVSALTLYCKSIYITEKSVYSAGCALFL